MPQHVVKPGDTFLRIAHQYGFSSWETIYQDPANADLRRIRPDPMQLVPGDEVFVPKVAPKEERIAVNRVHVFRLKRLRATFRVIIEDEGGKPLEGSRYSLAIDDETIDGTLGSNGLLELEIAPDPKKGKLTVWPDDDTGRELHFILDLGHLEPIATPAGLRARLANLGFDPGTGEGPIDEQVRSALSSFQIVEGLAVTGEPDGDTLSALASAHDKG